MWRVRDAESFQTASVLPALPPRPAQEKKAGRMRVRQEDTVWEVFAAWLSQWACWHTLFEAFAAAGCCHVSFRATAINARSCCPSSATPVHLSRQSSCRRSPSLALSVARSSFFSPLAVLGIHPFMSILSCPLSFSSSFPACLFRTFTPVVAHCVEVSRTRSGRGQVGDAAIDLPDASVIIQVTGGSTCPCMPFCMLRALCPPCGRSSPPLPFFFTNRPPHSGKKMWRHVRVPS